MILISILSSHLTSHLTSENNLELKPFYFQICSEKSTSDCCETGKLDKTLRDDWKKKKLEKWEKKHLGACKTKTFDACKGLDVTIKKKASKDTLKVSSITLEVSETDKTSSKK